MSFVPTPLDGETLAVLRAELLERGYQYLEDQPDRANRFINSGITYITGKEQWPFLADTQSGTTPLELSGVRAIRRVYQRENPDVELTYDRWEYYRGTGGAASHYWLAKGYELVVAPADGSEVTVELWRRPDKLESDDEQCVIPEEFSYVVLDAAAMFAAKDAREWAEAAAIRGEVDAGIEDMREALLDQDYSAPLILPIPED